MAQNIEIKARVHQIALIRDRAGQVATSGPQLILQRDTFDRVSDGRLKLREFGDGTAELIYYRRNDESGPTVSTYTRMAVGEGDNLKGILAAALPIRGVVSKRRELYLAGRTRIHLDSVDHLGSFLELEVVLEDGESLTVGENEADRLMKHFGVAKEDLVALAYIDLLESGTI